MVKGHSALCLCPLSATFPLNCRVQRLWWALHGCTLFLMHTKWLMNHWGLSLMKAPDRSFAGSVGPELLWLSGKIRPHTRSLIIISAQHLIIRCVFHEDCKSFWGSGGGPRPRPGQTPNLKFNPADLRQCSCCSLRLSALPKKRQHHLHCMLIKNRPQHIVPEDILQLAAVWLRLPGH